MRRTFRARKILVASIGVATVTYAACGGTSTETSTSADGGVEGGEQDVFYNSVEGNLMAVDTGPPPDVIFVGNPMDSGLLYPDAGADASSDAAADASPDAPADVLEAGATDSGDAGD